MNAETLFVAYYSSAEWGCHLALGWPMPLRVLDLYAEFCCLTSGTRPLHGRGLLGALAHYSLPALDAAEKAEMSRPGHPRRPVLDVGASRITRLLPIGR